jgi:hypothetical protein
LQYNTKYPENDDSASTDYSIRFSLNIVLYNNEMRVKSIDCYLIGRYNYELIAGYRDSNIQKYTKLKVLQFNDDTASILKYLNRFFVNFKKSVSNGDFNELIKNNYRSTHKYQYQDTLINSKDIEKEFEKLFAKIVNS